MSHLHAMPVIPDPAEPFQAFFASIVDTGRHPANPSFVPVPFDASEALDREAEQTRLTLVDAGLYEPTVCPDECERCGEPFRFGATTIGDRWVCNSCEQDEWEEHNFDLEQALNAIQEDEFSAERDEF